MSFTNLEQLPFEGMSYEFHGEKEGAPICAYIVNAEPGQGPPLHTHPYVKVIFMLEGHATVTVGDDTREVNAGASQSCPGIRRTALSTPATRSCVRSTSTPARDSFKQISSDTCWRNLLSSRF